MKNIKLNEDYNQASLDSNVSNAFKRAMNGQGDYAFVSFFLKKIFFHFLKNFFELTTKLGL